MENSDIRWTQRLDSYQRALAMLTKFIDKGELNELEEHGLIQAFEYTHELSWKLLKAFRTMTRIEVEIDDLLLPYLFDFSILSHIENPNVVDHINRVGIPFYQGAFYKGDSSLSQKTA